MSPTPRCSTITSRRATATNRAEGCAFAALGTDAARSGKVVRKAFAEGLEPLIDILAKAVPGRTKAVRRRKAVAAMAGLVGALTLARAVGNGPLSDEILKAAQRELLAVAER